MTDMNEFNFEILNEPMRAYSPIGWFEEENQIIGIGYIDQMEPIDNISTEYSEFSKG